MQTKSLFIIGGLTFKNVNKPIYLSIDKNIKTYSSVTNTMAQYKTNMYLNKKYEQNKS